MIPADLCMQTASLICITAQRFSTPLRINCVSIRHAVITRATEYISFFLHRYSVVFFFGQTE